MVRLSIIQNIDMYIMILDKTRVLGPVGPDHVSRKDPMRVYELTEMVNQQFPK